MKRTTGFLHAGVVNAGLWREQLDSLSDRLALAPDLPGNGARRDEPWGNFDSVTDRLAEWIRDRAHEPVDLVGLSLGAITGLHLAARHPDLVAGALVTGSSVLPYPLAMRIANRLTLAGVESPDHLEADGARNGPRRRDSPEVCGRRPGLRQASSA